MKLSKEAFVLFNDIKEAYSIEDPAGLHILRASCEAFDTMREAQKAVKKFGVVTMDERNRPKANPACAVERDSRAQMLAAFKLLKLDIAIEL